MGQTLLNNPRAGLDILQSDRQHNRVNMSSTVDGLTVFLTAAPTVTSTINTVS